MRTLFKFLLAFSLLLTGSISKGRAINKRKAPSPFSLAAVAHQKAPWFHYCSQAGPVLKTGKLHAENHFHKDLLELDEDKQDDYQKLAGAQPVALPASPHIDLHLAPGFFHKPRNPMDLRRSYARAYAGKPVYVLFGVFRI